MNSQDKEKCLRQAKVIVFRLLKFRLRSEHELRDKLRTKNLPNPIVEQTIEHFKELQIINDRMFAQQWVSSRLKKPFGLNRIQMELKLKGINKIFIQEVLAEAETDYDEMAIITSLAKHRANKYKNIEPDKIKQRVYGYLLRRGFNTRNIVKAIQNI